MGGGRGGPPESMTGGGEDGGGRMLLFLGEANLVDNTSLSDSIKEGVRVSVQ